MGKIPYWVAARACNSAEVAAWQTASADDSSGVADASSSVAALGEAMVAPAAG